MLVSILYNKYCLQNLFPRFSIKSSENVQFKITSTPTTGVSCWMVTININYHSVSRWMVTIDINYHSGFVLDGYYQHQLLVFRVGWLLSTPTTTVVSRWMITININYHSGFVLDGYYQH